MTERGLLTALALSVSLAAPGAATAQEGPAPTSAATPATSATPAPAEPSAPLGSPAPPVPDAAPPSAGEVTKPPAPPEPAPPAAGPAWVAPTVDVIGRAPRALDRIPGTASLLRREDLRQLAPQSSSDVLRTVPGLHIVPDRKSVV